MKNAKLLTQYEREIGETLQLADAVEGLFPWHAVPESIGSPSLPMKREICDTHMRPRRSLEELEIARE